MFKVNDKDTRTTPLVLVSLLLTLNILIVLLSIKDNLLSLLLALNIFHTLFF